MPSRGGTQGGASNGVDIALGLSVAAAAGLVAYGLLSARKQPKAQPLTREQWLAVQDDSQRFSSSLPIILDQVRKGGCAPELRVEVWPYLLRLDSPSASREQRAKLRSQLSKSYAALLQRCQDLEHALEGTVVRAGTGVAIAESAKAAQPLGPQLVQFAEAQRIIVLDAVRTDFSQARQVPAASFTSTSSAHTGGESLGRVAEEALAAATHLSTADKHAAGRLIHLLLAYAVHDPETGYCQGMSDLAVPMLLTFEDDALAFWCYERLMRTVKKNFRHDESGIKEQLAALARIIERADPVLFHHLRHIKAADCFFAYRMLIVQLRREMPIEQAVTLWEVLWAEDYREQIDCWATANSGGEAALTSDDRGSQETSQHGQPSLLLYFIAALILRHRRRLIDDCRDQDDTLRLFNSMQVDLWSTLRQARSIQRECAIGITAPT